MDSGTIYETREHKKRVRNGQVAQEFNFYYVEFNSVFWNYCPLGYLNGDGKVLLSKGRVFQEGTFKRVKHCRNEKYQNGCHFSASREQINVM